MSTIGSRIKHLRQDAGLSGAELARRIGIKAPSLWEIENGETKALRGNTLTALCDELRTTADYLLRGEREEAGLQLAAMEAELTYTIRSLPPEKRVALLEYARFLMGQPRQYEAQDAVVKRASVRPFRAKKTPGQA